MGYDGYDSWISRSLLINQAFGILHGERAFVWMSGWDGDFSDQLPGELNTYSPIDPTQPVDKDLEHLWAWWSTVDLEGIQRSPLQTYENPCKQRDKLSINWPDFMYINSCFYVFFDWWFGSLRFGRYASWNVIWRYHNRFTCITSRGMPKEVLDLILGGSATQNPNFFRLKNLMIWGENARTGADYHTWMIDAGVADVYYEGWWWWWQCYIDQIHRRKR